MIAKETWKSLTGGVKRGCLSAIHATSALQHVRKAIPSGLTTLVYHRVANPESPDFFGFRGNISATAETFSAQIRYLCKNFDVVSLDDVLSWVDRRSKLPRNAVLVTFDDGYKDNFLNAAPILRENRVRAVLFVATGFVDDRQVFYWDWICDAFRKTAKRSTEVPLLGNVEFGSTAAADRTAARWIEAAKLIPEDDKKAALASLARALDIPPPAKPPRGTHLDWQDIVGLAGDCFDVGCHTVNHPILSRIDLGTAEAEIVNSRQALELALGRPVQTFAYPNDGFGDEHEELLEKLGFRLAFGGTGGLTLSPEARRRRFSLRRSCIGLKDTPPIFAAKAAGLGRLAAALG